MSIHKKLHALQQIKIYKHAQKILHSIGHHKLFLAYFGICKIGLVLQTKYYRNIQTLIYKSDFSMWQHDLETHDGITT